ncbi:MAG: hypothetical protein ACFFD1_02080, partial [Candidatus Thorarchaeota archaeon]
LGLATIYQSDFLSILGIRASRTEQTNNNVTSSRAGAFTAVSFGGPGNQFSTIDHRGKKINYTLDGTTYQTNVSILNLVSASASVIGGNVTIFNSDTNAVAGSAYLQQTQIAKLQFKYRKDLILVSYPEWSGGTIVHDPSYSAVYVANPPQESSSSSSTTSPIDTTQPTISSGVPGFEAGVLFTGFVVMGILSLIYRRKRNF